ncbi:MAG: RNA pseudouridine synthase [Bacteroides sp.]|nr:RNA pseudouridine synthase [Bacteroides sp.]
MNNPFDYIPDAMCDEAFRKLIVKLDTLKKSDRHEDINFCRELEAGKMLGVLIAIDSCGIRHTLYAFSGQLGEGGFYHNGFVNPVFDYLQPDGYFKTRESDISRQNIEIKLFEEEGFAKIKSNYERAKRVLDAEVEEYKEKCRLSKLERNAKRESGIINEVERAAMIRQSQFEKAELHRLKKRVANSLEPLTANLKEAQSRLDALKEKRHSDSEALQKWVFTNFKLLNARGESKSLSEIFAETPMKIPPSGAGECCAPKLLQAAYLRGWNPLSIAEYWYGKSKGGEVRIHGEHYPACRGKCLPVLSWMLQGLCIQPPLDNDYQSTARHNPEIIYENQWFCIVNKPSGMLSVPGKGEVISVQQWLETKYGADRVVKMAHRLDQDTSGLLIATFGSLSFKVMQSLFAMRRVKKTYVAELTGDYQSHGLPPQGHIALPISPDWLDRPRQHIDFNNGKEAATDYEFIGVSKNRSRIILHPLTGRTHQLRVHAASEMGLGLPIVGDRLYGKNINNDSERLLLHAQKLEFIFPIDGNHYCFESPLPF